MAREPKQNPSKRGSSSSSWHAKYRELKHGEQSQKVDRKDRGPQKLSNVLAQLMAQRGYAQIGADEECREAWKSVVGNLEKFSRATEVKRGVLSVIVSNSVVMQELTFRKSELIAAMADALPNYKIKDLRFRIGSI